jgi:hypothetical protein
MKQQNRKSVRVSLPHFATLLVCALVGISGCGPKGSTLPDTTEGSLKGPATAEQAAGILDLSTFPMMPGATARQRWALADLSYPVTSDVKTVFEFQRKTLLEKKWKELPGTSVTEQSASGTFGRSGFTVSVSAYPSGKSGSVAVTLHNHGNVNLSKLPRPPGTKPVYEGGTAAMYVTDAPVPATVEACRKLILAEGWQPYGTAGDSSYFKQNAIRIGVTIGLAPAQGGKTMISFAGDLMSADLPAPPGAADIRYSGEPTELRFETAADRGAVTDLYRKTLATAGWKATLDKTIKIDENDVMIFRNATHDMLTLSLSPSRRGKMPVSLRHQSAAEIAELDRLIKEEAPKLRAQADAKKAEEAKRLDEANKPLPKVAVTLPAEAKSVEQKPDEIKFSVGHGKARAIAETWRKQFRDAGWKEDVALLEAMAGTLSFSKQDQSLTISYTDTGVMPTEVTLSGMRIELELTAGEK